METEDLRRSKNILEAILRHSFLRLSRKSWALRHFYPCWSVVSFIFSCNFLSPIANSWLRECIVEMVENVGAMFVCIWTVYGTEHMGAWGGSETFPDIATSLKWAWLGHTPSRGDRRESVSCLFQFLVAVRIPWVVSASLQSSKTPLGIPLLFSHPHFLYVSNPLLAFKETCDCI